MRATALIALMAAGLAGTLVGACASGTQAPLTTSAIAPAAAVDPVRGTPVIPGRPARMYVMVGFKEADCTPLAPNLSVSTPPRQGEVSFQPNQTTTVMQSASGKCTGNTLPGTGIYYTARAGATGTDTFTVAASSDSGPPSVRTFHVQIAE